MPFRECPSCVISGRIDKDGCEWSRCWRSNDDEEDDQDERKNYDQDQREREEGEVNASGKIWRRIWEN